MIYSRTVGGHRVYRPRPDHELRFKREVMAHLGTRTWDESIRDPEQVNEAVQFMFGFCSAAMQETLPKIASRDFVSFLLAQHDAWEAVRAANNNGRLSEEDTDFWARWGVLAKRAIHHVLEQIAVLQPGESPAADEAELVWLMDRAMIAAEVLVQGALQSTLVHAVFPDHVELRIRLDNPDEYYSFQLASDLRERMNSFVNRRNRPVPERYREFLNSDARDVVAALDDVFKAEHGITLTQLLGAGRAAHEFSAKAENDGFDVRFVLRQVVLDATAQNLGIARETLEPLFAGFVLAPSAAVERMLWKPKQEPRILRRPFVEMPHELGVHYSWVGSLVTNALMFRVQDLAFGRCPAEWETAAIRDAIIKFTQGLDGAWERTVEAELVSRGFRAVRSLKSIDGLRLDQEGRPGEIDLLLVDADGSLVVGEVKRTQPTYDPAYWRAELDEYVRKRKAYVAKHRKKVGWVQDNWERVCRELQSRGLMGQVPGSAPRVRAALITKYPTIASVAVDDWPIFCLAWLLEDFDTGGTWPF